MTPRNRTATLGLLVAVSLSLYLVFRVVQASFPAPTTVLLDNRGPDAVQITDLRIRGEAALSGSLRLATASAGGETHEGRSRTIDIAAGLPIEVQARVEGRSSPLACTLGPRPQGICVIRAGITAGADLQCDYECKNESPR